MAIKVYAEKSKRKKKKRRKYVREREKYFDTRKEKKKDKNSFMSTIYTQFHVTLWGFLATQLKEKKKKGGNFFLSSRFGECFWYLIKT